MLDHALPRRKIEADKTRAINHVTSASNVVPIENIATSATVISANNAGNSKYLIGSSDWLQDLYPTKGPTTLLL